MSEQTIMIDAKGVVQLPVLIRGKLVMPEEYRKSDIEKAFAEIDKNIVDNEPPSVVK